MHDRNDRMTSANALEVRIPFCDYRIVEYAYNIPWEMKAYKNREKGLIRYAMEGLLPKGVAWRKKSPFPKTHNPAYFETVFNRFSEIVKQPDCRITEILEKKKLQELIQTEGKSFTTNWYGQLMQSPQLFAYLIQMEYWLRTYNIEIVK